MSSLTTFINSFVLLSGQQDHDMNIKPKKQKQKHRLDIFVTIVIDTPSLTWSASKVKYFFNFTCWECDDDKLGVKIAFTRSGQENNKHE